MARQAYFSGIRSKLIFAFLAAFTPLAVLHFTTYSRHYTETKELIQNNHIALADSVESSVINYIESIIGSHQTIRYIMSKGAGQRTCTRYLSNVCSAHPEIKSRSIIAMDGSFIWDYPSGSVTSKVMQEPEIARILAGGMFGVSGVRQTRDGKVFTVASVVTPQHGKPVIVRSEIDANCMMGLFSGDVVYNCCVLVVDREGECVFKSLPTTEMPFRGNARQHPFIRRALTGRDTVISDFSLDGESSLIGYAAPIRRVRWAAVVLAPEDSAMASVKEEFLWYILSIFITMLGLLVMLYLGNHITAPIRRLSRGAAALAVGDLRKRIEVRTGDEFESLGNSFNQMAESLERHERELTDKTAALEGLFRIAQTLGSSLDLDAVRKLLVLLTCEVMGTHACALFIQDESGDLIVKESHNLSPGFTEVLRYKAGQGSTGRAFLEKRWATCVDIQSITDYRFREYILEEGLASVLSVPLIVGDMVYGALTVWTSHKTEFTPLQIDLLGSIASFASMTIHNAEMYGKEFQIAETLQNSLIGSIPDKLHGVRFGSRYVPALDESRIGGDFYDVIQLPDDKIGVVIADVSGKGLQAAIHTAMCKYMLRGFAYARPDSPAAVFEALNDAVSHFGDSQFFVTIFYAVIDPGAWTMTYANAGHPPPILITFCGKQQVMLYKTGTPMGLEEGLSYTQRTVRLEPGSGVFMYTDGIVEARREEDMLSIEGLQELLFRIPACDPQDLATRVCDDVKGYSNGTLRDDVAVVAFTRL